MKKLLLMVPVLLWAGSAWSGHSDNIVSAAHRLDGAAYHFYEQLKYYTGAHHAARDAKEFSRAASHFHKQAEYQSSIHHLWRDYEHLSRLYYHLHKEFRYAHGAHHDRHSRIDFRKVASAFETVKYTMTARVRYSRYDHYYHGYGKKGKRHGHSDRHRDRYAYRH